VLTSAGWSELINAFSDDEEITRTARELHRWIIGEGEWTAKEKSTSHDAFRRAVIDLISDEDEIWTSRMASLRILAETMSSYGRPLSADEKSRFASAAKVVVRTFEDNLDDADDINGEANELDALGRACGIDVESQVASLRSQADYVAEKHVEREISDSERRSYGSSPHGEALDLDSLFAGLLDS
jgi:hypothetical protein